MVKWRYETPEGFDDLWMFGDGNALTGLLFAGSRDSLRLGERDCEERDAPVFAETRRWLDVYFSGRQPDFTPECRIEELTPFRRDVLEAVSKIPFGETVSYGDIARAVSRKRGRAVVSARAVGGAVGWNPLCLVIPCHRVIGADGSLTGYGGGIANKTALLSHEAGKQSPLRRKNME